MPRLPATSAELHREEVVSSVEPLRWDVRSRLVVRVAAEDDGQEYSCRALHPALQHSPTTLVASLTLAVLRKSLAFGVV